MHFLDSPDISILFCHHSICFCANLSTTSLCISSMIHGISTTWNWIIIFDIVVPFSDHHVIFLWIKLYSKALSIHLACIIVTVRLWIDMLSVEMYAPNCIFASFISPSTPLESFSLSWLMKLVNLNIQPQCLFLGWFNRIWRTRFIWLSSCCVRQLF